MLRADAELAARVIADASAIAAVRGEMSALARHVAEVARRHAPNSAVPECLCRTVEQMRRTAEGIAALSRRAIATRGWHAVAAFEDDEREMRRLLSSLHECMPHGPQPYGVGVVADIALIGRCLKGMPAMRCRWLDVSLI